MTMSTLFTKAVKQVILISSETADDRIFWCRHIFATQTAIVFFLPV